MQRSAFPNFFQPHTNTNSTTTLKKEFQNQTFDLTIILDPDIFFIAHNGIFLVHPIIKSWLDAATNNPDINHLRLYLLSHQPGPPIVHLGNNPESYPFQLGSVFFNFLHPDSFKYVENLWNGKLQIATRDQNSNIGISDFTDGHHTDGSEIIVISADKETCDFYYNKHISVRCLDKPNQPIISKQVDYFDNDELEVYCDFDGTLFNCNHYLVHRSLTSDSEKTPDQQPLSLLQLDTIRLLQELQQRHFPLHLLTQRTYHIDQDQPSENNALNIVNTINKTYNLSIEANEESYLNSHEQVKRNAEKDKSDGEHRTGYLAKIEALYQRIRNRPTESRPKHIMLIDDDLREILKFYHARQYYEKIGVTLHTTLIMKLAYYYDEALKSIKIYDPLLYDQIKYNYDQELTRLDSGIEEVKTKQGLKQMDYIMHIIHEKADLKYDADQYDQPPDLQTPEYTPRFGCTIF